MQSSFNFEEITLDFLQQFQKIQYDLHCEMEMNIIEVKARVLEYQVLKKGYLDFIISQIKHYLSIFAIFEKQSKSQILNLFNFSLLDQKQLTNDQRRIPNLDQIISFCLNVKDIDMINVFTFSTLPSYFHFFSTMFNNSQLLIFFQRLANSTHIIQLNKTRYTIFDLCARSLFLAPSFLYFVQNALQPIFSFCSSLNLQQINLSILLKTLKKSWARHIYLIPQFINQILLLSKNPAKTLSVSFFELALLNSNETNPLASVYCLCFPCQMINQPFIQVFSSLLTYESDSHILNDLIQIMVQANSLTKQTKLRFLPSLEQDYFSDVDKNNAPSLFQPFLFSSFDYAIFDVIFQKTKTFQMPSKLEFYQCLELNEVIQESIHNEAENTMSNDGIQVTSALRHLLQISDPLPSFQKVPQDLTIRNFFLDYLVRKGPIDTLPQRIELFQTIEAKCFIDNPTLLLYHLQQTKLHRTKEIRAMSAFIAILDKIRHFNKVILPAISQIQKCYFLYLFIDPHLPTIDSSTYTQYYSSPKDLYTNIEAILKIVKNSPDYLEEIVYSRLTSPFKLLEYSTSKNLTEKDAFINQYLKSNIKVFTTDSFTIKHSLPKFDKNRWLLEQFNILKKTVTLNSMAHDANSEHFLLRKTYLFNLVISHIRDYLLNSFPPSEGELGQDEYFTFEIAFFASVIPTRIMTNASYLQDFSDTNFLNTKVVEILAVFKFIIGVVFPNESK